jgi:N-methylhydantoinase A
MVRIGVDVGGTFTDFAMVGDGLAGAMIHKQLTTPDDPSRAVLEGIGVLLERHGVPISSVMEVVHGTTLVTNAVIERKGAPTGMLVTAGFADLLDMGLEQRYDLFDLRLRFAPPVVPREFRHEITERTRFDGAIETHLDEAGVRHAAAALAAQGVEAVAICFLHSYANPAHEQRARAIVAAAAPGLHLSTSADIFPYMREFERWTTATVNAYTQPKFDAYLQRLELGLARMGFTGPLYLMSSSGGTVAAETARRYPVRMLESGPAAGVLMSALHGRRLGLENVLAFDLGGTTAKGALVRGGRPLKHSSMEVARIYHHKRGSGLALKLPVIDMTEIGAGGGSIAHIDERQLLRVGPRSAGAAPGPACYGRGGAEPTLTDANLVLGYLDPAFFLGGGMALAPDLARDAIMTRVGAPLGLDLLRAAWGIHETINEDIARAFRIHAVERGFDCRQATIVAFGGGGPIHATGIARKLKAPRVVFPIGAGVMSALGLLASPMLFETARSDRAPLDRLDAARFAAVLDGLAAEASAFLTEAGVDPADVIVERRVDIRYHGQGYELELTVPDGPADAALAALPALFAARYKEVFKVDQLDETLELITWKVEARGPEPAPWPEGAAGASATQAQKGVRQAWSPAAGGLIETPVWDRYALRPGDRVHGPALIEERESTCVLRDGDLAVVDAHLNLVAEIGA